MALPGLPAELDGLRIVHLSDFHLGFPSRGERAVHRAVDWAAEREPDLVADHRRPALAAERRAAGSARSSTACRGSFAVLGNHDFASTPRPVLEAERGLRPRRDDRPRRPGANASSSGDGASRSSASIRGRTRRARPARTAGRSRRRPPDPALPLPVCGRQGCRRASSTSSSPAICTAARSASRTGAASSGSRTRGRPTRRGSTGAGRCPARLARASGTTFVPFRFFARPEATELAPRIDRVSTRVAGLTGATLEEAPSVCHDCVWWQSQGGREHRQAPLDREGRGRLGRLGRRLPRRRRKRDRVDAVRPGRALSARMGAARGPAVRRRGARHLRVPRRSVEPLGPAVAVPRGDRRRTRQEGERARDVRVPLPGRRVSRTSGSSSTGRSSRGTSSRTSGSRPCGRRAGRARAARSRRAQPVAEGSREKVLQLVKEALLADSRARASRPVAPAHIRRVSVTHACGISR